MSITRTYSWFSLSLLWFGAAMSVAEIYTGGLLAASGIMPGIVAILSGHLLGVVLLGLMAYLGYKESLPSLMCTRISFGVRGSWLLSLANVMQLLGWTAVMMQQNSQALGAIAQQVWGVNITQIIIVGMGCLIALWTFWETQGNHTANTVAVLLLGGLAVLISWALWGNAQSAVITPAPATMSFGTAFDLSLVMPLSWVPLVADYASRAKSGRTACLAPALGYCIGSIWMYGLGFAGALLTNESNPTAMLLGMGFGLVAISVLAISTVVTTFLDVYSSVASARNVVPKLPEKTAALITVLIGTSAALFWNSAMFMSFLDCIGAVFAPLSAILLTDYYLLRVDMRHQTASLPGLVSLGLGIAGHVGFSLLGGPVGPTVSCLLLTFAVHITGRKIAARMQKKSRATAES